MDQTISVLTIGLPDDQHERLKALVTHRGISLNKPIEEWTVHAVAESDTEMRFLTRAARGGSQAALALLDKLNASFGTGRAD